MTNLLIDILAAFGFVVLLAGLLLGFAIWATGGEVSPKLPAEDDDTEHA